MFQSLFDHIYGINQDLTYWEANNPMTLAKDIKKLSGLKLYFDCGTEDGLITNSRDFSALLIEKKIPHEFRELPGTHSWPYWDRQVQEILKLAAQKLAAPADDSKQKAKGAGGH